MSRQYHRAFDAGAQDSLAKLARLVRPGSVVLDVGAGPGVLASYLTEERACWVDGIERDPPSARHGAAAFRWLLVADLDAGAPADWLGGRRYDAIVCADILEHLADPEDLLRRLAAFLKPAGRLLLSVPNVTHAGLVAELLEGDLRYRAEGLLDRTHRRLFTRKSLLRLLDECGLRALSIDTVTLSVAETEFSAEVLGRLEPEIRERLLQAEDATTYQFVVECVPQARFPAAVPLPSEYRVGSLGPIDVIVPVYSGLEETRACIESVLSAPVLAEFQLVVIDDCGPEPELRSWLRALAEQGRIRLVVNERNLGYVASVNRGMALNPSHDLVLLNSDAEVANDWLDRLRAAAYSAPDIGTVTPFANSGATICAYPLFCADNPMPSDWGVARIDALMRSVNSAQGVELPTAVGYCMFIRRDCLEAVGDFDAEAFGRGYGEENDFSMRARYQGWRHRLAADVFVLHRGGVSFGADKAALVDAAQTAMRERHPAYDLLVAEHIREDPAGPLRARADWQRLAQSPRPRLLFLTHDQGGGVERHVRDLARWLEPWVEALVLRPRGDGHLALAWQRTGERTELVFRRDSELPRLIRLLQDLSVGRVHLHHLLGIEDAAHQLIDALGVPYDYTVHDFYPACPRINLIDSAGSFCDQPPEEACNPCLERDPQARSRDIAVWRRDQGTWLLGAARVLAPSRDTIQRLRRVWPDLAVRYAPHDGLPPLPVYPPPTVRTWHGEEPLRVLILGQLSPAKGLHLVSACARDAALRGLPLEFHLIGHPLGPVPSLAEAPLIVHGAYAESELAIRIARLRPHLAWFPALWPETWSYTLSACLQAGVPIIAPALGAFTERLAGRPGIALLAPELSPEGVCDRLLALARTWGQEPTLPAVDPAQRPSDADLPPFHYTLEYLVEKTPATASAADFIDPALLAEAGAAPLPFTLKQSTENPLIDRLVRLREENAALHGGILERDAHIAQRLEDAARAWDELAQNRAELVRTRGLLTATLTEGESLALQVREHRQKLADLDAHARGLAAALQRRDAEVETIYRSLSWRLGRPARAAGRALRILRGGLVSLVQGAWHRVPLPYSDRFRIKSAVFRHGAPLFRGTTPYNAWQEQTKWIGQAPQPLTATATVRPQAPAVENLRIPGGPSQAPTVSVIVPVYNNLDYTLGCLDAIARHMPVASIEVLVVDDGSTDQTQAQLESRDDIRYLRNPENLGFVGSCNRGAAQAHGEFLFFLNNDTTVLPGWLDSLIGTFDSIPDAGLVGSKLIYPDGRLQEAGGIVWADGSGWNWGRLADPAAPEFNFLRDADYCSGAALMIRRALFAELGGFDTRYAPAYYEDTDLAFAVRARGLRVLYQPRSEVVHYEGVTSGTDLGSGVKAYQVRNRGRFVEKWKGVLANHADPDARPPRLSADRRPRARLLLIDACTPTPDQDSGSVDMINLLRVCIDLGYRVTFVPESNLLHYGRYTAALQALGVECLYYPFVQSFDQVLELRGAEQDAVMLTRGPTAFPIVDRVRAMCRRAKVIFNTVDLHFLRERRRAELDTGRPISPAAEEMYRQETYVIRRADTTIVVSSVEQELLAVEVPEARVRVIPLLREIPGRRGGYADREGILFVGGFRHPPNIDAMLWFCAEVWPLIRLRLPEVELSIVGSHMVPEIQALDGNGVRVLGFVEDIEPLFARARLSVAPLRYGAGQKGKVVTSLSYGVPCVLTSVAAEGLGLGDEEGGLVADDAEGFAQAVVRLYTDQDLWERLSLSGLARVEAEFAVESNRAKIAGLFSELGLPV